jgi:hypothetical protein
MEADLHLVVTGGGCADERELLGVVRNALALNGVTVLDAEVIPPTTSVRVYREQTLRAGRRLPEDVPQVPGLLGEDRPVTHDAHCGRYHTGRGACRCTARSWQ